MDWRPAAARIGRSPAPHLGPQSLTPAISRLLPTARSPARPARTASARLLHRRARFIGMPTALLVVAAQALGAIQTPNSAGRQTPAASLPAAPMRGAAQAAPTTTPAPASPPTSAAQQAR